ncbi:MAG: hypothetical protein Q8R60_12830 [Mycobacteriales bacterium]|nr:hypothetical protein [Mycobacteriales bacterium]
MTRVLISASVLALAVTGMSSTLAGTPDGQGAQKRALSAVTTEVEEQCEEAGSEDADTGDAFGFAILNAPGKVGAVTKVVGEVSLKKADPNETFMVFLAQDGMCTPTGTLTTNGVGNGNSHIDTPVTGVAGTYYVVLQDMAMEERYASTPVLLT